MNNMNVTITPMNVDGREFLLAEVSRGMSYIGMFRYSSTMHEETDVFYVGDEPIVKLSNTHLTSPFSNKNVTQISGSERTYETIKARLKGAVDNLYKYDQGLMRSAVPVLETLSPGLYVVHDSQVHASDGAGNFFWNAYNITRSIDGTGDEIVDLGNNNFVPGFLIPSKLASGYSPKVMYDYEDKIKKEQQLGGIAYHVAGMFSVLLEGHHAITASLINNKAFRCMMIERVDGAIYGITNKVTKKKELTHICSPYINIPIEELPENALERFLITRKQVKPTVYPALKNKINKYIRSVSRKLFPGIAYDKAEQLPRCEMVVTASVIDSLIDEQLEALLAGEVKYNEEYIVVPNHFACISAVADFLQITDFDRFIKFATDVLDRPELTTAHKFIAERLLLVMHPTINEYFLKLLETAPPPPAENVKEDIITETARKYKVAWRDHLMVKNTEVENYKRKKKKALADKHAIAESKGIATLEMAVRNIGEISR